MTRRARAALRLAPARPRGWLRRLLLILASGVVVLSVVGMHQLSLGHAFAAPTAAGHQQTAAERPSPATQMHRAAAIGAAGHPSTIAVPADTSTSNGASSSSDGGCPGCGNHPMAFSACLLALTLLVLSWRLAPPIIRLLPPRLERRSRTAPAFVSRAVPALSLTELSVLRR